MSLATLRDKFDGCNESIVQVIYDVWKAKGSYVRTQVRTPYIKIEDAVAEYGDCIFDCWYTEGWRYGRTVASIWIMGDEKHRVDPGLYENWTSGMGYDSFKNLKGVFWYE